MRQHETGRDNWSETQNTTDINTYVEGGNFVLSIELGNREEGS